MYPRYLCHFCAETDCNLKNCGACGLAFASHENRLQKRAARNLHRKELYARYSLASALCCSARDETEQQKLERMRGKKDDSGGKYGSHLHHLQPVICSMKNVWSEATV